MTGEAEASDTLDALDALLAIALGGYSLHHSHVALLLVPDTGGHY